MDHQMGVSMSSSLSPSSTTPFNANGQRSYKKPRSNVIQGRPLPLSRLLESVDPNTLKSILRAMCDRHPELAKEVSDLAPRPTVASALETLRNYEAAYRAAFPYGGNSTGDYAHNRVKLPLIELLEALSDYTPHFLPPNESQPTVSLSFLDGATDFIHRLPDWENPVHSHAKQTAYEEMSKAWMLVIQEAAKRGAGITLQYGDWESKLAKHNELSRGRMEPAVGLMRHMVAWGGGGNYSNTNARSQRAAGFGFGMHSGAGVPVRTL